MLAAVGCAQVTVGRRPTVAVLVTGDEIVPVHQKPTEARIRNSNGPALRAQALWAGARAVSLGVASDDETSLARALEPGLAADVLVVSGGVSAGAYDLVEGVFERVLGVEIVFRRVAIKPGAPLVFGHRGKTLVFGLPGNPVSAQVTFDIFVKPALLEDAGRIAARPSARSTWCCKTTCGTDRDARPMSRPASASRAVVGSLASCGRWARPTSSPTRVPTRSWFSPPTA